MTLFPVGGTWSLASVTPLSPRVPLAGASDDSLLLLIPVWPQHPLLGFHHLCNQLLALNYFSLHSWIGSILHDMLSCPCIYAFTNFLCRYRCYMHRLMAPTYRSKSQLHCLTSKAFPELNPVFISPDILGYIWSFCHTELFLIPATCWPFYASLPSLLNYPQNLCLLPRLQGAYDTSFSLHTTAISFRTHFHFWTVYIHCLSLSKYKAKGKHSFTE